MSQPGTARPAWYEPGVPRPHDYAGLFGADGTRTRTKKVVPEVPAERGLVVEDPASGFCGAVVQVSVRDVTLEDRKGRRRVFPMTPAGFLFEGRPATLVVPQRSAQRGPAGPVRSASGSVAVLGHQARTARASRIWVEGIHDAALVETVWGHDLRVEGIVVEPMHGMDDLVAAVRDFAPSPRRRLGILVDHLVAGSKETRAVQELLRQQGMAENVLVTGHPYVDVWEAVKPATVGIRAWPKVPRGTDWKTGVCAALRWGEPADGARRVLGAVRAYTDLETPLIGAVERLIDFVTELGE